MKNNLKLTLVSLSLLAVGSVAHADTFAEITKSKWSVGNLPCNLNGGAYTQYGNQYKTGSLFTAGGKPNATSQRTWHEFTKNADGSVTLDYKIYADGNRLMEQMTGSRNTVVGGGKTTMRVKGNTLYKSAIIVRIDLDALLNRQGVKYKTTREDTTSTRCKF
jgi:hypothetical protein